MSESDEPDWDSDEDEEEDSDEEETDDDEEETDDDEEETDDDEEETDDDEEETDDDDEEETDDDDEEETDDDDEEEETDDDDEEEDSDEDEEDDSESEGFEDEPGGLAAAAAGSNIEGDEEKGFEDEDPDKPRGSSDDNERAKMVAGILCCCCIILAVVGVVLGVVVFGKGDDPTPAPTPKPTKTATTPPPSAAATTSSPTAPPFTLPPTGTPTSAPTDPPVAIIPEMIEFESSSDTFITTAPDVTEAQGSGEVLQVFKGVEAESFTLIVFNLTDLPPLSDIFEREKTATIKLEHTPRDDGEPVSMTVFRLLNTTSDVEGLTSETWTPDAGVEGATFEVSPNATMIEIDVTDLLFDEETGGTDIITRRRHLETDDDSFVIKIQRTADGEPTVVPDEFGSRQSSTPPGLLIDIPSGGGGMTNETNTTNTTLCDVCPTGSFENADALVNVTAWVEISGPLGDEDMVECGIIALTLQNAPLVNEETCDALYWELAEVCGCANVTEAYCDVCPPSEYSNPNATVDLSVLSDVDGLEDIWPDPATTVVLCSEVKELLAVTDIGLDFWGCGGVAEVLSEACGCDLPVYCDACPPGEFENPEATIPIAALPLPAEFESLIPPDTTEVTCLQIEQLLAWMDLGLDETTCSTAGVFLGQTCGCALGIGRLRKHRRN